MAEITKCLNEACPIGKQCYRFVAKSGFFYQSYQAFNCDEENKYQFYISRNIELQKGLENF